MVHILPVGVFDFFWLAGYMDRWGYRYYDPRGEELHGDVFPRTKLNYLPQFIEAASERAGGKEYWNWVSATRLFHHTPAAQRFLAAESVAHRAAREQFVRGAEVDYITERIIDWFEAWQADFVQLYLAGRRAHRWQPPVPH